MMNKLTIVFFVLLVISCQFFASCHVVQEQSISQEEPLAVADLNKALEQAATEGDVEQVKALIASGADLESRILDGEHTPLMRAAYRGHYEVMKILIEAGADINAAHSTTHTVLYHALEPRPLRTDILQLLLDAGMNPTLMFWAIQPLSVTHEKSAALTILNVLIDAGADVNARGEMGLTPLIYAACGGGSHQLIQLLLRSGADVNAIVEATGMTALACAVKMKDTEAVRLLIEADADLEMVDNSGNTPLMIAKSNGSDEIVKLIIEAGATR